MSEMKNASNAFIGTTVNDAFADFPTRLEHSYFNDNKYWSLAQINMHDAVSNTTIHPRISWKATEPSIELPNPDVGTDERKWVWPTTPSSILSTFPFERLTHAYDTNKEEGGTTELIKERIVKV